MSTSTTVIYEYTLEQAVEDGALVEVFRNRWTTLSAGKPIVATSQVMERVSRAALQEIWNAYVDWKRNVEPALAEAERLFRTSMNGETLWVLEDGNAYTILYPEEY